MKKSATAIVVLLIFGIGGYFALISSSRTNTQTIPEANIATSQSTPAKQMKTYSKYPEMKIDIEKTYVATIKTSMGDIKMELFAKDSPQTVNNFVFLAKEKFYDGIKFHRIIKGFMVQTGDPEGTGRGGPGYRFKDELEAAKKLGYKVGIVAMANSGPDTNGSQFFIMDADYPLPANYSVFGQVIEGIDVVHKIASSPTTGPERSTPVSEIKIESVVIEEKE